MALEEEKILNHKGWVRGLLNEKYRYDLSQILEYWEKYKKEWEEMKKEFWKNWNREKFVNLIMQYKNSKEVYMKNLTEEEKEILDRIEGVWKEKFIEEYMHDKILYSGDKDKEVEEEEVYRYEEWKDWKVVMKEWVTFYFWNNNIWAAWAEAISKIELKEWVYLNLRDNNIWNKWAEALSKMELKEWVYLNLSDNNIWNKWAEALSKMELKEWVRLDLSWNHIWYAWA